MTNKKNYELKGKDEMNLAEFPITLLSTRNLNKQNTISHQDTIKTPDGKTVTRKWMVTGSSAYGLPLAQDNGLLLALLALGKNEDYQDRKIYFSRYKICKIMGIVPQKRNYEIIKEGLDRLTGVNIRAENAFWDYENRGLCTYSFGIIDGYKLMNEEKGSEDGSYVLLDELLFKSIKLGYIKTLDLKTFFTLKSPTAQQLYRYLDKKRYKKKKFEINLSSLAYGHLGFQTDTCKYPSDIKKRLTPAHQELIDMGFLQSAQYEKMADGKAEKVVYTFTDAASSFPTLKNPLTEKLIETGVTPSVAEQLVREYPEDLIQCQIQALPHHKAENPPALLIRAIQGNWKLPAGCVKEEITRQKAEIAKIEEEEKEAYRTRIRSYIEALSETEGKALTEQAHERALTEGKNLFKMGEVPDYIIEGYKHVIIEEQMNEEENDENIIATGINLF